MKNFLKWRDVVFSDLGILILLALAKLIIHIITNGQYGFHRDELGFLEDARYLAWGYVSYPPFTVFIARLALAMFGPSLTGLRFFAALGQSIAMVFVGLIARELGGSRQAQIVAALAAAIAGISLSSSSLFNYDGFDYLWWILIGYFTVRLLRSRDPRYWLGIGAVIGLGMMTKYTIAFYVAGLMVGVLLTESRRYLTSPWLWAGVGLSVLIFLPNLIWQIQNNFIYLHFLAYIHTRDIQIGRTQGFLIGQLYVSANPVTIPLWIAGLYFFFFTSSGRRYRLLGWMAVTAFLLFLVFQGRDYYTGPIYPSLMAGGAVYGEQWLASLSPTRARIISVTTWRALAIGGLLTAALVLPIAPVNSVWWQVDRAINPDPREEIGWPELVQTVAGIYDILPAAEKPQIGILAYSSEVGAINLFGSKYGLPHAIGAMNSDWLRGYGSPAPQTLIVVGWNQQKVDTYFQTCILAGKVTNSYGVQNEDTMYRPDIFLCRGLRESWPEFWREIQSFG